MKIQFEIKEKLADIVAEILRSEKWKIIVKEEHGSLKRIIIKDPLYDSEAYVEIWINEIHIKTAWSNYTYRIFEKEKVVYCEYIGAYRGLLEQTLLPTITPLKNILESKVLDTSISNLKKDDLRSYGEENLKLKNKRRQHHKEEHVKYSIQDHPRVAYDEFIKEGMPIPSPAKTK